MQVADHDRVVRRGVIFGGVRVQLVGRDHAVLGVGRARDGRLQPGAHQGGVDDHLRDLVFDVRDPVDAVRLGDELGHPDQQVTKARHVGHPVDPFPQPERVGDRGGQLDLAVEEHPVVGHVHVIEDHYRVRVGVPAGHRV